ncbi:MAG: aconitase X catalytic domain-containing protein [Magnetovibrio sp.]|nr:aconitase X catalytic domain-containing protein [Magnetovibrio sp.]
MSLSLTDEEAAWLGGDAGDGRAMAMRVLAEAARFLGADQLIEISSAHIDSCLYHGDGGVLFAEKLAGGGAGVAVPATLNVGALDLGNPGRVRGDAHYLAMARRQMDAYLEMGCRPSWTCAPYQAGHRPAAGAQVAWGESNAIAFVNSVLGARSERYGDFLDICCAVAGRAPFVGLHRTQNRAARLVLDVSGLSPALRELEAFYPVLGALLGREAGSAVAAVTGLPATLGEDRLKAMGAAAASTGTVGLFHVVGVTPEAPTLEAALQGAAAERRIDVTAEMIRAARDGLSDGGDGPLDCVALGSPHFSEAETRELVRLSEGASFRVPVYVCTGRHVIERIEADGTRRQLEARGVEFVVDTCVVVTPILAGIDGLMMTNSAKFAHYARPNTGYGVVFGSLADCVASAAAGRVTRDEAAWR